MGRRPASIRESLPGLWHMLRFFWPWIRKERALIARSLAAMFLGILMSLAEPWPLALVIDRLIPTGGAGSTSLPLLGEVGSTAFLTLVAIAVVLVTAVRAFATYYQKMGFAKAGNRVLMQIRELLYGHMQRLSMSFHSKARSGDLLVRVTRDVSLLRDVTSTALIPLFASFFILLGMCIIMLVIEWRLALVALATAPFFWLTTIRTGRGIHGVARKQREREGAMASTAAESITAMKVVQALSLEDAFADEFAASNSLSQKQDLKGQRLAARLERTIDVLLAVATALVLWFGATFVLEGAMTAGALTAYLFYLKRAFKPAKDLAKYTARLAKAAAAGERVLAILERTPDVRDRDDAQPAPRLIGDIHFDHVSFGYEAGTPVLIDLDLRLAPGTFLALVGPSGIGKSTLASLTMRLYDPLEGAVRIDGRDIREFTLASLRAQISVVLQDTVLFAASVRENISYGIPDATPERIEAAARLADAHEFITALPDGYDTVVGERGTTLSSGQRQRIAIARAAMRDTPILILDEPTTGLDEESGRKVNAALDRLSAGRTTILITHDLGAAARADMVAYLHGGRLVECGSPAELRAHPGRYRELMALQASGRGGGDQ